jgi:hypothetical protein
LKKKKVSDFSEKKRTMDIGKWRQDGWGTAASQTAREQR